MLKIILVFFMLLITGQYCIAQTRMPSFFSDRMVLQQNDSVSIWGTDIPKTRVMVACSWGSNASVITNENGNWRIKIATVRAGGPYTLLVKGSSELLFQNILLGEVWFCSGQSNMEMPVKGFSGQPVISSNEAILSSANDRIRFFRTPKKAVEVPATDIKGTWETADPAVTGNFSAAAYFFAAKIHSTLGIPIGIIQSAWGASTIESWMDSASLASFPHNKIPDTLPALNPNRTPVVMFNSMLAPFIGYTIRGVLWYQGEANRENAQEYQLLFASMIRSWRDKWKQGDFPFYFVQIAPFEGGKANAAFLREAQLKTMLTVPETGMVVALDIGDRTVIHPPQKKQIGDRLAYWALAKTYGIKGITYSGPVYKTHTITKEGRVILNFEHCENGLASFGKALTGFEIAGEDSVFHPATAVIDRDNPKMVRVWNDSIKRPVSVRYAFKSWTEASLFNTGGLPASSFRTDNW